MHFERQNPLGAVVQEPQRVSHPHPTQTPTRPEELVPWSMGANGMPFTTWHPAESQGSITNPHPAQGPHSHNNSHSPRSLRLLSAAVATWAVSGVVTPASAAPAPEVAAVASTDSTGGRTETTTTTETTTVQSTRNASAVFGGTYNIVNSLSYRLDQRGKIIAHPVRTPAASSAKKAPVDPSKCAKAKNNSQASKYAKKRVACITVTKPSEQVEDYTSDNGAYHNNGRGSRPAGVTYQAVEERGKTVYRNVGVYLNNQKVAEGCGNKRMGWASVILPKRLVKVVFSDQATYSGHVASEASIQGDIRADCGNNTYSTGRSNISSKSLLEFAGKTEVHIKAASASIHNAVKADMDSKMAGSTELAALCSASENTTTVVIRESSSTSTGESSRPSPTTTPTPTPSETPTPSKTPTPTPSPTSPSATPTHPTPSGTPTPTPSQTPTGKGSQPGCDRTKNPFCIPGDANGMTYAPGNLQDYSN